ncbi:MAG: hypothetical protein J7M30_13035 [Deltaproteobacteria bacterium]|nr:hypothetical protein [Deltaproteobacteria bacterium]
MEQDIPKNGFHFLDDSPVTKDEFGSHSRVADSIAQKVESNVQGMTVGLEGTWGSGKSSVIRMLEERWKERDDIRIFTFDAWAHQGDPLRRSFLEELIHKLQSKSNGENQWLPERPKDCKPEYEKCNTCNKRQQCRPDEIRDELRLRREHNIIASEPTITGWGIGFAIAALAMPIGVALLSAAPKLIRWYFWLGTVLASSPLIIIAICILSRWLKKDHASQLLGEFIGKTKEISKHTTHRSVDPTAIEFREYYREIIQSALENCERKLVIVVDNLDRVEPDTALTMWGTMHTFLETNNSQENKIAERIWIIVPYDSSSIGKLWEDKHKGMSRAFKEKTFQSRYRVALPLASRWENYFKIQLKKAIAGQKDEIQHAIYHIFRIQALPAYGKRMPTPREVKLFINRMVALAQKNYPDVSLEEIALYVATELSEEGMLNNLAAYQSEREKLFVDFVGKDWRYGLAAIYFGVPREDAAEVLYEPLIRESLTKGDSEALKSLFGNSGAVQCCDRYLKDVSQGMSTEELLTASAAFSTFNPQDSSWYTKECVKNLAKRVRSSATKDWKIGGILTDRNAEDVIRLMEFDSSIRETVRDKLSIRVTEKDVANIENIDDQIASWVRAAVKIVQYLATQEGFDPTLRLRLPDSKTYLKILDLVVAEPNGKDLLRFFCPADSVTQDYLNTYLENVQTGEIRAADIDIVQSFLRMTCWAKSKIEENIASAFQKALETNLQHERATYAFKILHKQRSVGKHSTFGETLKAISENGRAFQLFQQYHGQPECAAFCLGTILLYHPAPKIGPGHATYDGQQRYHECLKGLAPNIAQHIAAHCIKFGWLEDIVQATQDKTDVAESACLKAILQEMVNQDANNNYLTTDRFIVCHSFIKFHLNSEENDEVNLYEKLVGKLLKKKNGSLLYALLDREIKIEFGHAYHIALCDKELDISSLAKKLCKELKECLQKQDWVEQLEKGDEYGMLGVAIELVKQGYKPNLDNKFVDALIEHARRLIDKTVTVESLEESWPKLLDALSDSERAQFRRQLPDVVSNADSQKSILPFLPLYKHELDITIQEADKTVKNRFVDQACMNIANRNNSDELTWMILLFKKDPSLIGKVKKQTKESLKNRLQSFLTEEYAQSLQGSTEETDTSETKDIDAEWLSAVKDVAKQLGIKLEVENNQESKDASREQ